MKWISVEERLPEIGKTVLAWKPEGWIQPLDIVEYSNVSDEHRKFIRKDGQWWNSGKQITHWMPLPKPPNGKP